MRRTLARIAILLAVLSPAAVAAEGSVQAILIQAEKDPAPGYAFADPVDRTAGWLTVNASPNPGFPNSPERISIDSRTLPEGNYRLSARVARWAGTPDTTPIAAARFADNAGHALRCQFPADRSLPRGAWFAIRPGGVIGPEGQWAWIPLFETGPVHGTYELVITGEPGTGGSGNYKGLWIDALRFEPIGTVPMPSLPEDRSLPGQWDGGFCLSPRSPLAGQFSLSFPFVLDGHEPRPVRRVLREPVDASQRDHLAVWILSEVPVDRMEISVHDAAGHVLRADACQLADMRPLEPGAWHYVLMSLRGNTPTGPFEPRRLASIQFGPPSHRTEPRQAVVSIYRPHLVARTEALAKASDPDPGLLPAAARDARVAASVLEFPRAPAGPDKKIILWARGGWGGMPSAADVRRRIKDLYRSGADGIVLTLTPRVDGKPVYFADRFMSPERFRNEDYAADMAELHAIDWGPLDHSLLRINVMPGTVDWFDDQWAAVVEKAGQAARLCREGRLAGLMLDTEQYDWQRGIFRYDNRPHRATRSLADYAAQARRRGQQMAKALVAEMPDIDVLTTFGGSLAGGGSELLLPLLEGMASVRGCHVYDGCEPAYSFRTLRQFLESQQNMHRISRSIGAGFGVWVNHPAGPFDRNSLAGNYRSPDGLAHSLHYALRLSDKYVWLYAEGDLTYWPETTPPEYYAAIRESRKPHDPRWTPAPPPVP